MCCVIQSKFFSNEGWFCHVYNVSSNFVRIFILSKIQAHKRKKGPFSNVSSVAEGQIRFHRAKYKRLRKKLTAENLNYTSI